MPPDKTVRQPQLAAKLAHFVLEQLAQGLQQLQLHPLRQAADIVVRLDRHRRAAREGDAFDHIGIERALRQEIRAAEFRRLLIEHIDEQRADRLALGFRVGDAVQRRQKAFRCIDMHERNIVRAAKQRDDLLRLALAQQPVIDEDAGELIADGLMDQHGGNSGVDAAGQSADHLRLADLSANLADHRFAEGAPSSSFRCSRRCDG